MRKQLHRSASLLLSVLLAFTLVPTSALAATYNDIADNHETFRTYNFPSSSDASSDTASEAFSDSQASGETTVLSEPAAKAEFKSRKIYTKGTDNFDAWSITDNSGSCMYLISGTDQALLIDSGALADSADIYSYAVSLVKDLPVSLFITGAGSSKTANIEDFANRGRTTYICANDFIDAKKTAHGSENFRNRNFTFTWDGDIIDLGGISFTVYQVPTRTEGGMVLVSAEKKLAFVSDAFDPGSIHSAEGNALLKLLSAVQIFRSRAGITDAYTAWTNSDSTGISSFDSWLAGFESEVQAAVDAASNAASIAYLSNLEVIADGVNYFNNDFYIPFEVDPLLRDNTKTVISRILLPNDISTVTLYPTAAVTGAAVAASTDSEELTQQSNSLLASTETLTNGAVNGTLVQNADGSITASINTEKLSGGYFHLKVTSADQKNTTTYVLVLRHGVKADNPIEPLHYGRYDLTAAGRSIIFYVPQNAGYLGDNGFVFTIVGDHGSTVEQLYKNSGWKEFADQYGIQVLFTAPGPDGWNLDEAYGTADGDLAYLAAAAQNTAGSTIWQTVTRYIVGYGDGAVMAQMACAGTATYCGAAAVNASQDISETFLASAKAAVNTPVWIINAPDTDSANAAAYWKEANRITSSDRPVIEDGISKYVRSAPETVWSGEADLDCYRVWISTASGFTSGYGHHSLKAQIFHFLTYAYRTNISATETVLHHVLDLEKEGMVRHYEYVDGWKRLWYSYVPDSVKAVLEKNPDAVFPVMIIFHGYTSSPQRELADAGWLDIADREQFIIIEGRAYAGSTTTTPVKTTALPTWNYDEDSANPDDVRFFQYMLDYALRNYHGDRSRVYVSGFSMGSWMTHIVGSGLSDEIAAIAPRSGIFMYDTDYCLNELVYPTLREDVDIAVWMMGGDKEAAVALPNPPTPTNSTGKHINVWLERLHFEPVEDFTAQDWVTDGRWSTISFSRNDVELFRYSMLSNYSHLIHREQSEKIWEFFSHYRRADDGSLIYIQ